MQETECAAGNCRADALRRGGERARLRALLLDGANSATGIAADAAYFTALRSALRAQPEETP